MQMHWGRGRHPVSTISGCQDPSDRPFGIGCCHIHDTVPSVYLRSATPLSRGQPVSTMGVLSTALCRATISSTPAASPLTARERVGEVDPVVQYERSSLDVGRSFVPLNTLVGYRLVFRESSSPWFWLDEKPSQGFTSFSLVFTQAPLRTDLWAV